MVSDAKLEPDEVATVLEGLRLRCPPSTSVPDVKTLHGLIAKCTKCKNRADPLLPAWNFKDPKIVLVAGRPASWSKEAKATLVDCMKEAGLSPSDVMLTYVTRCAIIKEDRHSPTSEEVSNCEGFLFDELTLLNPKVIVSLGRSPISYLLGQKIALKDYLGKPIAMGPWITIPTYDPTAAGRKGEESITRSYVDHFSLAKSYIS